MSPTPQKGLSHRKKTPPVSRTRDARDPRETEAAPINPTATSSHNPDTRVAEAPLTRRSGSRDLQRDYSNLYDRSRPPGDERQEEAQGEYNEAYGRGGFPANFYGRDAEDSGHPADEPLNREAGDEDIHWRNESPAGTETDRYYRATNRDGFVGSEDETREVNDEDLEVEPPPAGTSAGVKGRRRKK